MRHGARCLGGLISSVPLLMGLVLWNARGGARAAGQRPSSTATVAQPASAEVLTAPAFTLTLDEALLRFRSQGFELLLADAAVQSAHGDEMQAAGVPNPVLSASVLTVFGLPKDAPMPDPGPRGVGINALLSDGALSDVLSGKRGLRLQAARAARAAAQLNRTDAQRVLEFQLRQQYLAVAQLQLAREFAREVVQAAAQTAELNRLRLKAGAISEAEQAKTDTALLDAEQRLDELGQRQRLAQIELLFLLGSRGPVPEISVDTTLMERRTPRQTLGLGRDQLLQLALQNRPDLRAADLQIDRAEATVRLMRRLNVPDFQVQVGYTQQGSGVSAVQPPTLSTGLAVTLPLFYQRQGERARAAAELSAQKILHDQATARVLSEVESAYVTLQTSQRLLQRMESQLLERAKRARDLAQIQYQKGAASLLEYLDAQRTYISVHFDYLHQRMGYWVALFQLEQAVGAELLARNP